MLYYAVKSVDNKPVNKIYDDWDQCKIVVWGKKRSIKVLQIETMLKSLL